MSWVRLDDKMAFNAKVVAMGNAAVGARDRMMCWTSDQGLDGFVPDHIAKVIAGDAKLLRKMVDLVVLEVVNGGYQIHDFLKTNPTAAEVEDRRSKRSAAGAKGGEKSGVARGAAKQVPKQVLRETEASAEASASQKSKQTRSTGVDACFDNDEANTNPVPSRPDPVPKQQQSGGAEALPYDSKHEAGIALLASAPSLADVDPRELRPWGRETIEAIRSAPLPSDVSPVAYLRLALEKLGDQVTAQPAMPVAARLRYLRRTAVGVATDDKPRGWPIGRAAPPRDPNAPHRPRTALEILGPSETY